METALEAAQFGVQLYKFYCCETLFICSHPVQEIETIRETLRQGTSIHLTESGIICNSPPNCSGNDYGCYYTTADFTRTYWVASAAQWLYQFLLSSKTADLATVAQSQILGYPAGR